MISALNIAATGMNVSVDQINTTAFNLSNLQTTGFKNMMLVSSDLKYQTRTAAGIVTREGSEPSPTGVQFGSGAKTAATFRVIKQGNFKPTGDPLHLAIQGSGYFKVDAGNGKFYYTRNGNFRKNSSGYITTAEGYFLQPQTQIPESVKLNDESFQITENGSIQSKDPAVQNPPFVEITRIALFNFPNEAGLTPVGNNLFEENADASGAEIPGLPQDPTFGAIFSKNLEESTVDAIEELTNAIAAQRAYELNSKIIKIADEMLSSANQIK